MGPRSVAMTVFISFALGVTLSVVAGGCSISSLIGGDIPCTTNEACPPGLSACVDGRCAEGRGEGETGEGEGETGEGEGEGEGEGKTGEGEGESGEGEGESGEGEGEGPSCGDGHVDGPAEECDDGNASDADFCTNVCTLATCGDQVVQEGVEECDGDGDNVACTDDCRLIVCGDGRVEGNEACDDGNTSEFDGCTAGCQVDLCGNGLTETGERCDDGNRLSLDGCSARCDAIAWRVDVGTAIGPGAGPVLLDVTGAPLVVVGTTDGEVVGLLVTTGQVVRVPVVDPVVSVVVTNNQVVIATASGDVVGIGFEAGNLAVVWRRDDVAVAGGRARLATVDDRVFFVTAAGGVRALDGLGQNASVTSGNNTPYPQLATAPAPLTAAACDPCLPSLVSSADDQTPPGAVIVPMGNTLALWNVENGCAPARLTFSADATETARGRAVPALDRTVVVTSRGALVRVDGSGDCADPLDGVRRIEGTFRTEPITATGNVATWVVADGTRLNAFQVEGTAPVASLTGYPAALPPGRTVIVPAARDDDGEFVVVDTAGEVHVFGAGGARRSLGTVEATPASGPLLVAAGQGGLVIVATTDGQVIAVEGGDRPATSGWHRDGGDQRSAANGTCAQAGATTLLPLLALLGRRGRRGRR